MQFLINESYANIYYYQKYLNNSHNQLQSVIEFKRKKVL